MNLNKLLNIKVEAYGKDKTIKQILETVGENYNEEDIAAHFQGLLESLAQEGKIK